MNDNQGNIDRSSKLVAGLVGLLAIVADLITIGVFLFQAVSGNIKHISEIASFNATIITLFGIAIALILYSRSEIDIVNKASKFISLYYIVASVFVLIYLSFALTFEKSINFGGFLSYVLIASMYSFFGSTVYPLNSNKIVLFFPYLVGIACQITIILYRVSFMGLASSYNLFGLLFVIGLTGLIAKHFQKKRNR